MKVGIITFYNGNRNYGGILQAYALQKAVESMGHECLQISLDNTINSSLSIRNKIKLIIKKRGSLNRIITERIVQKQKYRLLGSKIDKINSGFVNFEHSIPHTENTYSANSILELNDEFDAFICGSDQVWTPNSGGLRDVPHRWNYFLKFAKKKKISYAASFGVDRISIEYRDQIIPLLNRFDAISVREQNAKNLIQSYIDKPISVVIDPVLLIDEGDWKAMAGINKACNERYLFSYILGSGEKERKITSAISNFLNYKLVTVPFIGDFTKSDLNFGDFQCIGINPEIFLNYIMNSEVVVTDSFHCVVFSIIFEKTFIILERTGRNKSGKMSSRLVDLLSMLGLSDRIVHSLSQASEILRNDINYESVKKILGDERTKAYSFLKQALKETD